MRHLQEHCLSQLKLRRSKADGANSGENKKKCIIKLNVVLKVIVIVLRFEGALLTHSLHGAESFLRS